MRFVKAITLFLVSCTLIACGEPAADISKPSNYNKNGIDFSYPSNWEVTEDSQVEDVRYLFIETPGDAIVIMQLYTQENASDLQEYAEWFSSVSKEETPLAERITKNFSTVVLKTNNGSIKGVRENFSIKLVGINIPHRIDYYRINGKQYAAYIICQSATEDLKKVAPGFALITKSFKFE